MKLLITDLTTINDRHLRIHNPSHTKGIRNVIRLLFVLIQLGSGPVDPIKTFFACILFYDMFFNKVPTDSQFLSILKVNSRTYQASIYSTNANTMTTQVPPPLLYKSSVIRDETTPVKMCLDG